MKKRIKTLLFSIASIMLLLAFACTPPDDDPIITPPPPPDEPQPVQLVRKWVSLGWQHGSEFTYVEQNRIEFYSDSTYICYWFDDEQRGTYSMGFDSVPGPPTPHTRWFCTFSSPIVMSLPCSKWRYWTIPNIDEIVEYNVVIPDKLRQWVEESDLSGSIIQMDPFYIDCFMGCLEYFIEVNE